jgi:hypothetical protein
MDTGIVYLIQPCELIGTERYKVGYSKHHDMRRIIHGYNSGSIVIFVMSCKNPLEIEKEIKKQFKEKFKLISGNEFFEGNINLIKKKFIEIIINNENFLEYNVDLNEKIYPCIDININLHTNNCNTNTNTNTNTNNHDLKTYSCDNCNFICYKQSNWIKHTQTDKHKYRIENNIYQHNFEKYRLQCKICNKTYNNASGLWYHKKKNNH